MSKEKFDSSEVEVTVEDRDNEQQQRITFQSPSDDARPKSRIGRRRQRSRSRDSRTSSRRRSRSITGVPIEFRTLSIQVADSQQVTQDIISLKEDADSTHKGDSDLNYFKNLRYHLLGTDEVCQQLSVSYTEGLAASAVSRRLQRDGTNTIPQRRDNYLRKILRYVFGGFCSVLWIGVIIFFLCWRPLSNPPSITNFALAILVLIVIFLQASFSAFQDWSTKRVMNSILDLLPSETLVLREGSLQKIPASQLVAGDIVNISIGNKVPADLRLLETSGDIRFDRSVLTGESDEIEGAIDTTDDNFLETRNIALMGTNVTNGNGVGVVVLTGGRTVMGRIAKDTYGVKDKPTLIQQEIDRFVRIIVCLTVALASLILFSWAGWLRTDHPKFMNVVQMLNNVMGCVVAFIPEGKLLPLAFWVPGTNCRTGMPVGVALTLMRVAHRMKKANILPKGLSTVETLGCVSVICSDKTGTLTQNKMFVTSVSFVDEQVTIKQMADACGNPEPLKSFGELHKAAILCNDATFDPSSAHLPMNERNINGNATDGAVLRFAETVWDSDSTRQASPRVFQVPFNSKNKWMLTMHEDPEVRDNATSAGMQRPRYLVYMKGAPDVLLPKCSTYWSAQTNSVRTLDDDAKQRLSALQERLSRNAERVIILCQRTYTPNETLGSNYFGDEIMAECIQDLTIIGILGITDPPREETAQTVASCRRAGARFFMVTGDFHLTAAAIARNVGIFTGTAEPDLYSDVLKSHDNLEDDRSYCSLLLEGWQIAQLMEEDWNTICCYEEIVFARTTPEQKLRIVNEFKARDNVVAVTGDGVNDAPALRAADVGIAVVSGSDVAIEAADLVLLDKFDSIVEAIRLGRLVFQNLQKVIAYLLPAGSWSEIWPVLMNVFIGVPLPLSAFLMIMICVFTDLFLCLTLIMEKEEFDLLDLPPRNHKKDHLINIKIYAQSYLFIGVMETICAHSMFFYYYYKTAGIPFHALVFAYDKYGDGFYGYTADELTHFNSVGQCIYFVTLVILQWGNILSIRNKRLSILQADPIRPKRRNPWIPAGALVSLIIAIFVTEVPWFHATFGTAQVPIEYWFLPLPLALGILSMDEVRKLVVRCFPNSLLAKIAW